MAGKLISDLNSGTLSLADAMEIDKDVSGTRTSFKTTVKDIVDFANHNVAEEYDSTSTYAIGDYVMYESTLYKCITAVSSAENFDSTKWTAVLVTDEMGSGGGGGTGGHTIIDENGNSMTARAGLQFFGAVEVTDDSANNRTLVEVLGGDFYNPVIYSTEEREVGVWTDGKPLYQKTFIWNPTSIETTIEVSSLNIDKLVKRQGTFTRNSSGTIQQKNLEYRTEDVSNNNYGIQCEIRSTNLLIRISAYTYSEITEVRVTLQYTKTTDAAGSGSWTPQGVPAVHYSTDEQIIGTWIDGSTIYERTWYCSSIPAYDSNKQGSLLATGFTDYYEIIDFKGSYKGGTANAWGDLNGLTNHTGWNGSIHVNPSGDIVLFASSNSNNISNLIGGKAIVTIQYTKSS